MTDTPQGPQTAQELTQALISETGMSRAEIARELGRDPRMVSKILRGETRGSIYQPALRQLYETGRVTTPPFRRRGADGHVVPVRSREGLVTPEEPQRARRGAFDASTTYMPDGGRQHEVILPRTEGIGRERGRDQVMQWLRSAARAQRWGTRHARFQVQYTSGRVVEIGGRGGYRVSDVLSRSRAEGNDPLAWVKSQRDLSDYVDIEAGAEIVGVTMTITQ